MTNGETLDSTDLRLLDLLQQALPLEPRPFRSLAQQLDLDESQCIDRIRSLKNDRKIIRQISAIFDTQALGYDSTLVAAKVAPEKLEAVAGYISTHPGVSHNYQRQHDFNLWFTLAVSPDSALGRDRTLDMLRQREGVVAMYALPTLRLYKIGVRFQLGGDAGSHASPSKHKAFTDADRQTAQSYSLQDMDRSMIRVLQQDLPIEPQPFHLWAQQANVTVEQLLTAARRFETRRQMRRFSAVLRHRAAGVRGNVMGVWQFEPDQVDAAGKRLAKFDQVSHCYRRPTHVGWPYQIYTMVHASTPEAAGETLQHMQQEVSALGTGALWTVKEFKKQRVRYFTEDEKRWEEKVYKDQNVMAITRSSK